MNFKEEVLSYLGKNSLYEGFDLKKDTYEGDGCSSSKKGNKNFLAGELTPEEIEMINLFRKKKGKKPLSSCGTSDDHTNGRNGSVKTDKVCKKCGKEPCQCSDDTEEEASVKTKQKKESSCFNY
jgi:hypothetical protein